MITYRILTTKKGLLFKEQSLVNLGLDPVSIDQEEYF